MIGSSWGGAQMYEFMDDDGGQVSIRSGRTLASLVTSGRISASTLFKVAGERDFVPASQHPATMASCPDLTKPAPVEAAVADGAARRAATLVSAARAMKPVIDFLTARKLEGGVVGMRLEPPPERDAPVTGRLSCARLRPGAGASEEYALSVASAGMVSVTFPAAGGENLGWSAFMTPADLALAIMDAEIRAVPARVPEAFVV